MAIYAASSCHEHTPSAAEAAEVQGVLLVTAHQLLYRREGQDIIEVALIVSRHPPGVGQIGTGQGVVLCAADQIIEIIKANAQGAFCSTVAIYAASSCHEHAASAAEAAEVQSVALRATDQFFD